MGGGTDHVESGVTDHNTVFPAGIQAQKIGNHIFFGGSGLIYGGTADLRKIPGQVKVLQDFPGCDFRLGGGDIELPALGAQSFQSLPDAGIGRVFKLPDGNVAAAEDLHGFVHPVRWNAELAEGVPQGRSHKDPQFFPGRDRNAQALHSEDGAVDDALTGICQCAVQIK